MSSQNQVNKPTNSKIKEADVNRKLQLYGIVSAFKSGKVPSNDQIDVALSSFLASKPIANPSKKLSEEGQAIAADFRNVVEQAKLLLLSKNEGNLLQDFIYQTSQFDPKTISKPGAPVNKEAARAHGQDALQGFKTLGTLLVTNGQFRKLLKDATVLLRDVAGDAATKTATRVKPSDEQLSRMDEAAADNTWHEAPDFSKEKMRKQMQGVYKGSPKKDLKNVADSGNAAAQTSDRNDVTAEETGQASANAAKASAQEKLSDNVPDETKEKAKARKEEARRRAREYFNQKMPTERRDQVVFRLKKMVMECQAHPDYMQAVETLLNLAEQYGGHASTMSKGGSNSAKQTRTHFQQAEVDLKTLIERSANGTSLGGLFGAIDTIYKDADKDPELKDWFRSVDKYIRRCLQEQGYIMADVSNKDGNRIYDQGRYLLREKYRTHTNRVVDEARFLGEQFEQDPMNKTFGNAMQKLFNDLGKDSDGKPAFKPHLVKDISEVIIPAVLENIAYIPVPRIEYTDPQIDAIIENLVLESDNFAPNILEVASDHSFRWGRKQRKGFNQSHNAVEVSVKGVQMDLRDVSYHIKKKQGFPSVTDTGVADILLPGDGLSFKMKMSTAEAKDRQHFFKVDKVDVDVKGLKINVKQSKHKLLFKIAKPIMLKAIRPAIQKAAEKAIKDEFNRVDALLFDVKQEAEKGADMERADGEGKKPSKYARYVDALKKKMVEGKQKAAAEAEAKAEDKKMNMAMTKDDSIFPSIHLPGGISSKATEYKELARKGDKWESPVFSIGKAEKTQNIPAPPEIKRKEAPHHMPSNSGNTPPGNGTADYPAGNPYTNGQSAKHGNNGQPLGVSY
ncbi:hypothetical protein MKZ38_002142 [Zalerion maritima]|uniref:Uncharacterized protein n=1 Tax=Zalerion maritima TaxID=339359 RepID=A0AAD5WR09_9PEZI|nr:hypothetical protein MKZ38_002142 [Zalerion maritima]